MANEEALDALRILSYWASDPAATQCVGGVDQLRGVIRKALITREPLAPRIRSMRDLAGCDDLGRILWMAELQDRIDIVHADAREI